MTRKSFTTRKDPIEFDIDDEVFSLKASVPAGRMTELSRLAGEMQAASQAPAETQTDPRIAEFSRLAGEILTLVSPEGAEPSSPAALAVYHKAIEMQSLATAENVDHDATEPIFKLLAEVFESESLDRFKRRFDGEYDAIDIGAFYEILTWVIGEALGKGITLPQSP
jgi:hypothetical protein